MITREEMLTKYKYLVHNLARRAHNKCYTIDLSDFVQAGWLGLFEAYNRYSEKKSAQFITYAYFYIKKHIQDTYYSSFLVKVSKHNLAKRHKEVAVDEAYNTGLTFIYDLDMLCNMEYSKDMTSKKDLQDMLSILSDREKNILIDKCVGRTLSEISIQNKISIERVRQILLSTVRKLKKREKANEI
jgi:RNA polymerase sigma factor (sigma-70 family)